MTPIDDRAAELAAWKLEKEYAEMVADKADKASKMAADKASLAAALAQYAKAAKAARYAKAAKAVMAAKWKAVEAEIRRQEGAGTPDQTDPVTQVPSEQPDTQ